MTVQQLLQTIALSARFEANTLLAFCLGVDVHYLYAYPEMALTEQQQQYFYDCWQQRQQHKPLAYIMGKQAFYHLEFHVSSATLIPRPETELLVEHALALMPSDHHVNVADLGTGCGAIALTLGHLRPNWQLLATDMSLAALKIAQKNQQRYQLQNIQLLLGDWCTSLIDQQFDLIISNPPYIASHEKSLMNTATDYEPTLALFAEKDGLLHFETIIQQAKHCLKKGGYLLLEHGFSQAKAVRQLYIEHGFVERAMRTIHDLAGLERVTIGQL